MKEERSIKNLLLLKITHLNHTFLFIVSKIYVEFTREKSCSNISKKKKSYSYSHVLPCIRQENPTIFHVNSLQNNLSEIASRV